MKNLFRAVLLVGIVILFASACNSGDGDRLACEPAPGDDDDDDVVPLDDDAADDTVSADDTADDDTGVDAVSSASPGKDSSLLTESHSGWQKADCASCHASVHMDGFLTGECVTCHGSNGAPLRPAGHDNADCASCHADKHAGLSFKEQHCTACHKYEAGTDCPYTEDYDVVVIGAGGGGLAAAATLAKYGMKVALLEKHYKVGGYMTNFKRGDYRFEVSLHAMDGLDRPTTEKSFDDFISLGIYDRLEWIRNDPMYRSIWPDNTVIDVPADMDAYKDLLKGMFPDEKRGIEDMFQELRDCDTVLNAVMKLQSGFSTDALLTILGDPITTLHLLKYMDYTLKQFVAQFVNDRHVTGVWEQLVTFIAGGPSDLQALFFMSMWNGYHQRGYYYVKGGSQAISEALADVFKERGGTIKLNTLVTKIVIEDGKAVQVQAKDDACYNTRYVVSNANAPSTMLSMVGADYLPAKYVNNLNSMEIAYGTFQVWMGLDKDYSEYFPGSHEIMVNTTWDMDEAFDAVKAGDLDNAPYIIANYTIVDPTTAPEGKNAILMTTYLPYDWEETWGWDEGFEAYDSAKQMAAEKLITRAEEVLPELGSHIEVLEVSTPVTNYAFSLNPFGTILGWTNQPEQATLNRLPQQTPIGNLVLAGAWTFPGGGQSAVINSGCSAAEIIMEKEGK